MSEKQPNNRSFRISEENDKVKEIMKDLGVNQQEALTKIMKIYRKESV